MGLRAQGATEYLVLLAVVLIIALVSIALLGFFPGISTDAKATQSEAYWKSAYPFAVIDHRVAPTDYTITLVVQNKDPSPATLSSFTYTAQGEAACVMPVGEYFGPGEVKTLTLEPESQGCGIPSSTPAGGIYELSGIELAFLTEYGTSSVQYGSKPIVGKFA